MHRQTWEERQASQDRQSFALREVLGGIETYKNPFDSHTVEVPAGYQHQWVNPQGQVILSNNPMYDPRHGSNVDWRSMERYKP
jgi:secreted PhoX family phosphatase